MIRKPCCFPRTAAGEWTALTVAAWRVGPLLDSNTMADQIMTASKERLRNRMGVLSPHDLKALEDAILTQLGIRR